MKKFLGLFLALVLILSCAGCGEQPEKDTAAAENGAEQQSGEETSVPAEKTTKEELAEYEIDPPYDFDVDTMQPRDFGDYFAADYPDCTVSTYKIGESETENEVTLIESANEGPTVYVIAGVHGDEAAAWNTGKLLKKITLSCGKLYVLAPANRWGAAQEEPTRYVTGEEDLNRSFPGSADGNMAERVANTIYQDVERAAPDFVFDLHEARIVSSGRDFLGSCIIFTDMTKIGDLVMDIISKSENGELFSEPLNYYSPGPAGSVNQTITTQLGVPTITVETFRGYPMERRIGDQLDLVQYTLRYYGMVE